MSVRDCLLVFLAVLVAGLLSIKFSTGLSGVYAVWWPNGILLAALLVSRKQLWPLLLFTGGLAILFAHATFPIWQPLALWLVVGCLMEVWVAASFIRWWADDSFTLTTIGQVVRFLLIAVVLAPTFSAVFSVGLVDLIGHHEKGYALLHWYFSDALGIAIATPVMMAVYRDSMPKVWEHARAMQSAGFLTLLAVGGCFSLMQRDMAVLGLLFPVVTIVVVRMGWIIGAFCVFVLSVLASGFTAAGLGPFAALSGPLTYGSVAQLQIFLAALAISTAITARVYEERRRMLQQAREKERSIRLLTESSPDVIMLTDLSSCTLYTARAITAMLGYHPQELYRQSFYRDLIHPDEVPAYLDALEAVRSRNEARTIIYRMLSKNATWTWAEACISLYRDEESGDPIGFIHMVRDITRRKEAEERLQSAYHELEVLAAIDSLTGIANRRHFDAVLDSEWKRAIRSSTTLSMLLIDVDCFKDFNDIYGHLKGDECLREVATIVSQATRRSTDMVFRFGGEEFAVVLPETDEANSSALAERIRDAIQCRAVRHTGNAHEVVTISVGCAAVAPARDSSCVSIIEAADKALYRAKHTGRNRVVRASQMY